jgi:hypothetical protein
LHTSLQTLNPKTFIILLLLHIQSACTLFQTPLNPKPFFSFFSFFPIQISHDSFFFVHNPCLLRKLANRYGIHFYKAPSKQVRC